MADETSLNKWPVEDIPDADLLYYRVHKMWIRDGNVIPAAFRDRAGAMPMDWDKYSTPAQSRNRAKVPADNAVVSFITGDLRNKAHLAVAHSPDVVRNNRAHTDVKGEKDEEARLILTRLMKWSLGL